MFAGISFRLPIYDERWPDYLILSVYNTWIRPEPPTAANAKEPDHPRRSDQQPGCHRDRRLQRRPGAVGSRGQRSRTGWYDRPLMMLGRIAHPSGDGHHRHVGFPGGQSFLCGVLSGARAGGGELGCDAAGAEWATGAGDAEWATAGACATCSW